MCNLPETIVGVPKIAVITGDTVKALYHRFERYGAKAIPGARKRGKLWTLHLPTYRAAYAYERAAA